ncbi:MAG: TlpA disulfide reductase family protein [Planctomycetota bacterium]|nr:TlpA disulfide reductase family protein [Planctomycetota bacterium]
MALLATFSVSCDSSSAHSPEAVRQPAATHPEGLSVAADLPTRWIGTPQALWINSQPDFGPDQPARATLVRFWTDTCPFCEASLPAIESLRKEFGPRGLRTLGIYHPKPPRVVTDTHVAEAAARLGYHGPIGVDEQWAALQRMWLGGGERRATSASLLLDEEGVVRFVHPGPEFHPSRDPGHADCDRDYRELRAAILAQLEN